MASSAGRKQQSPGEHKSVHLLGDPNVTFELPGT